VRTWPAQGAAEQLRQWPALVYIAERVEASPLFVGLLLIGSFAAGRADDVSDIDLVAVVAQGRFAEAWADRRELDVMPREVVDTADR
jgi:predicted nucleotidyltransferase